MPEKIFFFKKILENSLKDIKVIFFNILSYYIYSTEIIIISFYGKYLTLSNFALTFLPIRENLYV